MILLISELKVKSLYKSVPFSVKKKKNIVLTLLWRIDYKKAYLEVCIQLTLRFYKCRIQFIHHRLYSACIIDDLL